MYAVREFCKKRKTGKKIEDAFIAYCKASISDYFSIGSGQTATGILAGLTENEIEKLWLEFVADLKKMLVNISE